jgi:glycosyltransferase involved in cell wall biosynthesis
MASKQVDLDGFHRIQLPSESQIMSTWKTRADFPLVSIVCTAYNHERYIEDALRGFLSQVTDFPFEIIVHDDASTDRTAEIINHYRNLYPHIVRPIFQTVNQYSISPEIPLNRCLEATAGEYIALCEGDDFWIHPLKLQKQIDALSNSHHQSELCFHPAIRVDATNESRKIIGRYARRSSLVSAESIIKHTHGQIPTASLVLTRGAAKRYCEFMKTNPGLPVGDIYLQAIAAAKDGALFIAEPMSVYRIYTEGSWTARTRNSSVKIAHALMRFEATFVLDRLTNGQFHSTFMAALGDQACDIVAHKSYDRRLKTDFLRKTAPYYATCQRLMFYFVCYMPRPLLKVVRKYRSLKRGR